MSGHKLGSFHWLAVVGDPELNRWSFMAAKQSLERQRTHTETAQFIQLFVISVKPSNISDAANLVKMLWIFVSQQLHLGIDMQASSVTEEWLLWVSTNLDDQNLPKQTCCHMWSTAGHWTGQRCPQSGEVLDKDKRLWLSGLSWWCFSVLMSQ